MSTVDTMARLLASWHNSTGQSSASTPLPGLRPEVIRGLAASNPDVLNTDLCRLLRTSCGIAGTALGDIDFTGQWYPEEPLAILRPCLSLVVDDLGRRWLAEIPGDTGLPGPVWCVFPQPAVTLYVSDDLGSFLSTLRECAKQGCTVQWLRSLSAEARAIWAERFEAALRSRDACRRDRRIRGWLSALPFDAHIYDLRPLALARGWPYGLKGPSGRLYRCGRLPVFAVAGPANTSIELNRADTGAEFDEEETQECVREAMWPASRRRRS